MEVRDNISTVTIKYQQAYPDSGNIELFFYILEAISLHIAPHLMGYAKFNMCYEVIPEYNEMESYHVTISPAIPITDESGEKVLLDEYYTH